jgi:Uma2 family endonuclease
MRFALTMYNARGDERVMVQETRAITADELLHMPDDGYKYELVAGRLRKMTPAGVRHGVVGVRLVNAVSAHVERHNLGITVGPDTGYKLASNPDTVRAPDVSFVARERIPVSGIPAGYWPGAPDLAVEVMSPTDRRHDIEEKIDEYLHSGVRLIWFVEPSERRITVYRPREQLVVLTEGDTLDGGDVLPGFSYPVARLFAFDQP